MLYYILFSIVIGVIGIHYVFKNYNFFKRHGIIHESTLSILGSLMLLFRLISINDAMEKLYNFHRHAKYFGFYVMTQPTLLIRDPELIKDVLVKSFDIFPNRRFGAAVVNDALVSNTLFCLQRQRWRDARSLLSHSFTPIKMKSMFVLMSECALDFVKCLPTLPPNGSDIDIKDAFSKFTNDVHATCAFGIKVDSMRNPTNEFYSCVQEVTSMPVSRVLKLLFLENFPRFARVLNVKFISDNESNFFKDIIKATVATRDAKNITRPDVVQSMMDIRGKREAGKELSIDDMTASAFVFFFAGFGTTSTTISFAAHEIAINPDVQIKLRQEIDQAVKEANGEITYEIINRLKYLDAVIHETLRLYPPISILERVCDNTYELPSACPGEKPFTMKKGMVFAISVYAIQRDEKYYDNPNKFCPERFLNDKAHLNFSCYTPFGNGPRMCVASRFSILEIKVLLFHLLTRYELKPCAKTTIPMKFSKKSMMMMPVSGFWLNVQRRSDINAEILSKYNE